MSISKIIHKISKASKPRCIPTLCDMVFIVLGVYNVNMDVKELYKLQDNWVAFSKDRKKVVAKAKELSRLLNLIGGKKDLIVSFVPRSDVFLSP